MAEPYTEGDIYSYHSVTLGHVVTWTRDADGVWHADDDRVATATDLDVKKARRETGP